LQTRCVHIEAKISVAERVDVERRELRRVRDGRAQSVAGDDGAPVDGAARGREREREREEDGNLVVVLLQRYL
jgi:hypothetical protein